MRMPGAVVKGAWHAYAGNADDFHGFPKPRYNSGYSLLVSVIVLVTLSVVQSSSVMKRASHL